MKRPSIANLKCVSIGLYMMPHQLDTAKKEAEEMIKYIDYLLKTNK